MKANIFLNSNGNVPNKANEPIKVGERMSFKESIFAVYYSDERVVRKINWDQEKVKKIEPKWDPSILEKAKKIEPFWKKF